MLNHFLNIINSFGLIDVLVIGINFALFLFAGTLLNHIQGRSNRQNKKPRMLTLREREVQGEIIHYETYQSRLISIVILVIVTAFLLLTILSVWELESWMRQTSVLGGLAIVIFFTKDLWLPDNINGLILLYKTDVVPGSIIRVRKLNLLAITLRTSLIETSFRDLVHGQRIIVPNSMFRNQVIEVINSSDNTKDYVEFNIGYNADMDNVKAFLQQVFLNACELEAGINAEAAPRINVVETGDHAVTWRLTYVLENPYRLRKAQMAVSEAALACSADFDIGLNTPLTHRILDANLHPPGVNHSIAAIEY